MPIVLRSSLFVLALAAAVVSTLYQSARDQALAEIEQSFAEVAPTADVARRLDQVLEEPEPVRRSIVASRELIGGIVRALPPESTEQRLNLVAAAERARELAAEALEQRPADADASAQLGAATYLARTLDRDRRLFTESEAWEKPLEHAIELAPGSNRASEFLAMAYLDVWSSLSEEKRQVAVELLRAGFREPDTFKRLISAWLRLAPDLETALAIVPDDPFSWQTLTQVLSRAQRWSDVVVVEARRRENLVQDIERRLNQADRRIAAGRSANARLFHVGILKEAEIDGQFAPSIDRVLKSLPPGPVDSETADRIGRWLDWTLDLCLLQLCPFDPEAIRRLDVLSGSDSEALHATAALAAQDLVEGERILRLQGSAANVSGAEWGRFRLLAARAYRERHDLAAAQRQLDSLNVGWRSHPVALWEEARLHDVDPEARRARGRTGAREQRWEASRWSREGPDSRIFLDTLFTGSLSIELEIDKRGAAVLALSVDGRPPRLFEVETRRLDTGIVVTPGLHLLETTRVAGREVRPGDVILAP